MKNIRTIPNKTKKSDDSGYFYFPNFTKNLANRIKLNTPVLISGPTGCGKTELAEHLAEMFGVKLLEIDFSVGTTEANIVGRMHVENGETKFHYGALPTAMTSDDTWILLDEIDFAEPEHLAVLQPVLTGKPLIITQNKAEVIIPKPTFRIIATANTKGRGDETQSYTGTKVLNLAFIDRFSIFEMDYTAQEKKIVEEITKDKTFAFMLNELFKTFRKGVSNEEIVNAAFSTRRMIQISKLLKIGETLEEVFAYELINRFEETEKPIIKEYIFDHFDKDFYLKDWTLGKEHKLSESLAVELEKEIKAEGIVVDAIKTVSAQI